MCNRLEFTFLFLLDETQNKMKSTQKKGGGFLFDAKVQAH